jgi:hypothetical protein
MSKRLQVLMSDHEMEALQWQAANENLSVGEFVRQALREVHARRPVRGPAEKLAAIRRAVEHSFPTADIEQMNREIESGYLE